MGPGPGEIPVSFDRYRVIRRIGRGGQGEVYLAHDPNLDIDVAIKVLHPDYRTEEFMERFTLEARTMVRLTAANIVRVYDFNPSYPYIVMEYCGDGDLTRMIKSRRRMSVRSSISLVKQICRALIAAHEHDPPVVHRDLKPGNVLFQKNIPKVADFGLAKVVGGGTTSGLTTTRGMMGTVAYASPEQLTDASKVDHRTDLWAVGVILYELLTFRAPFEKPGDEFVNVAIKVRTEPPATPVFEIPGPLKHVIDRALTKNPAERYASAREMVQAIDGALAAVPDSGHLLLPPDEALEDVDRMAAEVADLVDSGSMEAAQTRVREMRKLSPDSALGRYWEKRILEKARGPAAPSAAETPTRGLVDSRLSSIQALIAKRDYREARRQIGELLIQDPDNTKVHEYIEKINRDENLLIQALNQAHEEAEQARAAGDLQKVHDVWKALDERYPDYPDIRAELAVAGRELELIAKRALRARTETEAQRLQQIGDLSGAVRTWDAYLGVHPDDAEAAAIRESLHQERVIIQQGERLEALESEAARLADEGKLEAALSLWELYLDEKPETQKAMREADALRRRIAAEARQRAVDKARSEDAERIAADDFLGALAAWQRLLLDYPGDPEIAGRVDDLTREIAEREKAVLLEELEEFRGDLEVRLGSQRYDSLPEAKKIVTESLVGARVAATGGPSALSSSRDTLLAARRAAEAQLSEALGQRRRELCDRLRDARELSAENGGPGPAAPADQSLETAIALSIAAMCDVPTPDFQGDPLAPLAAAGDALREGMDRVIKDRKEAIDRARDRARTVLDEAEEAVKALQLVPETNAAALAEQLAELRGEAGSSSASRLGRVSEAAEAIRAQASSARTAAVWSLTRDLGRCVDDALELQASVPGERLRQLSEAAVTALEPPPGESPPTPAEAAALRDELSAEIELRSRLRDEAAERARARWKAAQETCDRLRGADLDDDLESQVVALKAAGEMALAGSRHDEVEQVAEQIARLAERHRLEIVWRENRAALAGLEGPTDRDGVATEPSSSEDQELLSRFRREAARGATAELESLGAEVKKRAATAAPEGGTPDEGEAPSDLGARARRFNERHHPEALDRFDKAIGEYERARSERKRPELPRLAEAARQARGVLLEPPSRWPWLTALIATVILVAAAVFFLRPEPEIFEVTVMSLSGEARISSLTRDGAPVDLSEQARTVTESGVTWSLEGGRYVAVTESDQRIEFDPSRQSSILVPPQGADYVPALIEELGLEDTLVPEEP